MKFGRTTLVTAGVLASSIVLTSCGEESKVVNLTAAGATFPAPLYQNWFKSYASSGGHRVNYQAVGSGAGVRQFEGKTVDFGASDKALSDKKIKEPVVQIPMTGGAIAVAYNNPGCDLLITQKQLADVYLGKITNWSDLGCESKNILVTYRSDGSGTTAGFTNSLSAFSSEWKDSVGTGKAVDWPIGVGGKGNSGVAGVVSTNEGSIGYVNYGYTANSSLQVAAVENREGNFVLPNSETSSAGLSKIVLDDKLRGADPNPTGKKSYPIVSLTWILAYPEHEKNAAVKDTLRYMLSDEAQSMSDSLGYVPLPESIRKSSLSIVETLK
jgi:phosphate transport system substrate-binding protein